MMADKLQCPNCNHYEVVVSQYAFLNKDKVTKQISVSEARNEFIISAIIMIIFLGFFIFTSIFLSSYIVALLLIGLLIFSLRPAYKNIGRAERSEYTKTKLDMNSGGVQYQHNCMNCNWTQYENRYNDGRRTYTK